MIVSSSRVSANVQGSASLMPWRATMRHTGCSPDLAEAAPTSTVARHEERLFIEVEQ